MTIDLISSINTFLFLLDTEDKFIEINDDGGSNQNSRIQRSLAPGNYKVVAATFSSGKRANFRLTITGANISNFQAIDSVSQNMSKNFSASSEDTSENHLGGDAFFESKTGTAHIPHITVYLPNGEVVVYSVDLRLIPNNNRYGKILFEVTGATPIE